MTDFKTKNKNKKYFVSDRFMFDKTKNENKKYFVRTVYNVLVVKKF